MVAFSGVDRVKVHGGFFFEQHCGRHLSDDDLAILHFLFGKNFERATAIVDQGGVKRVSGNPSGRVLFLVAGESKKEEYVCFPDHLCTCHSFFFDVVSKGEQLCCKHQIAVQLAESVVAYKDLIISDEELAMILCRI